MFTDLNLLITSTQNVLLKQIHNNIFHNLNYRVLPLLRSLNICMCAIWTLQNFLESLFFKFIKFGISRWHFSSCCICQKLRNSLGCRNCLGHSCTSTLGIYYVIILCSRHLFSKRDLLFCNPNYNYDFCVNQFEFASYGVNILRHQTT
jgi:hypothetical protein